MDNSKSQVVVNYSLFINLLLWILSFFQHGVHGILRGPPRVQLNEQKSIEVARLGEEFRLTCPVESDPSPIVDWYKDGEDITAAWSRFGFKRTSRILRIRPIHSEDSGIYECKGVNGFGSTMAKIRLIVIEDALLRQGDGRVESSGHDKNGVTRKDERLDQSTISLPPELSRETLEQSMSPINLSGGNTIRIRCEAKGSPTPQITWLKNGKPLGEKLLKISSWTLVLSKLEYEDSGTYDCVATNTGGRSNTQIQIHVTEMVEKRRPELASGFPTNMTVLIGNEAIFECIVRSGFSTMPPHLKWLKRVPSDEEMSSSRQSNYRLLPVENTHVLVIQETQNEGIRINETVRNGTFVSKLIISKTDLSDEGSYLCLATNSQGYTFKEAKLTLLPGSEITRSPVEVPFPLIVIGLSIITGLLLIGLAYLVRKYQEKNKKLIKVINPKKISLPQSSKSCSNFQTHHHHPTEGCEQRQLLVSTSTRSSVSSSSDPGSRRSGGEESHFHSHSHRHHHHRQISPPDSIPLEYKMGRQCSCYGRTVDQFSEISIPSNPCSKYPNQSSFDTCYNNSFVGSMSHSIHFGHWT